MQKYLSELLLIYVSWRIRPALPQTLEGVICVINTQCIFLWITNTCIPPTFNYIDCFKSLKKSNSPLKSVSIPVDDMSFKILPNGSLKFAQNDVIHLHNKRNAFASCLTRSTTRIN